MSASRVSPPQAAEGGWPTAASRVVGVIGDPVRHSLSPVLHNAAYREMALDWAYVAFAVESGSARGAVAAMRALNLAGLTVTMPHKDGAAAPADHRSGTVALLRSANTLRWTGGPNPWEGTAITAESTDGAGFMDALTADGSSVAGKRCAVLGTGGASRAVIRALAEAGAAEVMVFSRDHGRAQLAATSLAPSVGRAGSGDDVRAAEIVINGTPVGMTGMEGLPLDPAQISSDQLVIDLIYNPVETPLIRAARDRDARTMNGLPMLVFQAARQIELWTGMEAPRDTMLASVGLDRARLGSDDVAGPPRPG